MKRKHLLAIFLTIIVIAFALVYWLWPNNEKLPVLDELKPVALQNVHGGEYDFKSGKVKLVTFFYTNCPDICPLTMADFKDLQAELKKDEIFDSKVELVAISLDPEQDTPSVVKKYAESFGADSSGWKWLRGSLKDTKKIADDLKMQYKKGEGNFLSHSTTMYLIDENNKIRALYDMAYSEEPIDKRKILSDIQYLVNQ
ncbi:SCO family protein [Priestia endophytica]|uniref:Electron transport protein SCO1/SenC n=1 Tax=Priestia endophytica TaxID=135735 RepID=A0AAX1Q8S9_9BACI|nr:SCO family protein [Priestia endophytica]MBG9812702.1 electron transport protein SCO1/SenC [Priestia endophytica]RAS76174.1 electron transport protein SCO1/SenC [Priestia endophytica]RAS85372.1 electron transport protein SCO1/SenC [Priestia endophytica]RAS89320.1 electron transport protein SCO1/SenC [Priestia endophytica]